jgi:putative transposase
MPDHLHTIWTLPEADTDAAGRWKSIKARFSASLPTRPQRLSHGAAAKSVWQRSFWQHRIGDGADFELHMRSCQMDPVRHGLVDVPEAWPYSSFRNPAAALRSGLVDGLAHG